MVAVAWRHRVDVYGMRFDTLDFAVRSWRRLGPTQLVEKEGGLVDLLDSTSILPGYCADVDDYNARLLTANEALLLTTPLDSYDSVELWRVFTISYHGGNNQRRFRCPIAC